MKASENKNVKLKPQPKHLRTRVDYLIKVLQNQINIEKFGPEWKEKQQMTNKSSRSKKKQTNEVDGADSTINNLDPNSTVTVSKSSKKKNALKDVDSKANLNQRSSKKSKRKLDHDHVRDLNDSDNSDSNSDTKVKIIFIDKSRLRINYLFGV